MLESPVAATDHPLSLATRLRAVTVREGLARLADEEQRGLDTYYADHERLKLRIQKFSPGEDATKLDWRRGVTIDHFQNHVGEIGDSYAEMVYASGEVTREVEGAEALNKYFTDVFGPFWEGDVAPIAPFIPELYCYLDMPPSGSVMASLQQQAEAKAWARPSLVFGSSIVALERDRDGALAWISRKMEHRTLTTAGKEERVEWFEVRDAVNIYALGKDGEPLPMLETGTGERLSTWPHEMKGIPVVPIVKRRLPITGCGTATFKAVIDMTLAQLNVIAMLVEAGYLHLSMDFVADPETLKEIEKQGGRGNAAPIPVPRSDSTDEKIVVPHYLVKPLGIHEALMAWAFEEIPREIYQAARLRDRSANRIQNQSGIAKAFDAVPEFSAVKAYANWLRNPDAECVRLIALSYLPDIAVESIQCRYPADFAPQAASELIADLGEISDRMLSGALPYSAALLVEFMTTVVRNRFPDMDKATLDGITKELAAAALDGATEAEPATEPTATVMLDSMPEQKRLRDLNLKL